MGNANLIELRDIYYRWPNTDFALEIKNFSQAQGEKVFLHGPSGSGKSSLLALIAGVLKPDKGELRLLGQSLTGQSLAARDRLRGDHIGFVFQQFNLLPYLSVIDNVMLPCRFSARRRSRINGGNAGIRAEAERLLARLGLPEQYSRRPVNQLSVGQQQRVAVARALIGSPELVIADEPTSALDAAQRDNFLEMLFQSLADSGAGLLFVSHDLSLQTRFERSVSLASLYGKL